MAASSSTKKKPVEVTGVDYDKPHETPHPEAADAAETEAEGGRQVFQMPLGNGDTIQLTLPRKWKRFKFMRALSRGDIWGAIETVGFSEEQLDELAEAEVDEQEFQAALERLGETITGKAKGKSDSTD